MDVYLDGLGACEKCGRVWMKSWMAHCNEVLKVKGKSYNTFMHYCPDCAPPWTSHTNVYGDRYYRHTMSNIGRMPTGQVVEVDKNGVKL